MVPPTRALQSPSLMVFNLPPHNTFIVPASIIFCSPPHKKLAAPCTMFCRPPAMALFAFDIQFSTPPSIDDDAHKFVTLFISHPAIVDPYADATLFLPPPTVPKLPLTPF